MNKKIIIFVTAMVLAFAIGVGATLAYFTSFSGEVTNTFVSGGFATLTIEEKEDDGLTNIGNNGGTNTYEVVPGIDLNKDPQVTFTFDSGHISNAYVFVKITYGSKWSYNSTDKKFSATVGDDGDTLPSALITNINTTKWSVLKNDTNTRTVILVYKADDSTKFVTSNNFSTVDILAKIGNTVNTIDVSADLTETQCEWIKNSGATALKLDFKAYAIQSEGFAKASDAWAKVSTLG